MKNNNSFRLGNAFRVIPATVVALGLVVGYSIAISLGLFDWAALLAFLGVVLFVMY